MKGLSPSYWGQQSTVLWNFESNASGCSRKTSFNFIITNNHHHDINESLGVTSTLKIEFAYILHTIAHAQLPCDGYIGNNGNFVKFELHQTVTSQLVWLLENDSIDSDFTPPVPNNNINHYIITAGPPVPNSATKQTSKPFADTLSIIQPFVSVYTKNKK